MERREFIKNTAYIVSLSGILTIPIKIFGEEKGNSKDDEKTVSIPIEKVKKLQEIGGWVVLKIKNKKIMFIRTTKETILAIDAVCTHQGCTLKYKDSSHKIVCPCHFAKYDLSGKVIKGPAKKNLKNYNAKFDGKNIVFKL